MDLHSALTFTCLINGLGTELVAFKVSFSVFIMHKIHFQCSMEMHGMHTVNGNRLATTAREEEGRGMTGGGVHNGMHLWHALTRVKAFLQCGK